MHDVFPYDPARRFSVLRTPGRGLPAQAANEPESVAELDPELVLLHQGASSPG